MSRSLRRGALAATVAVVLAPLAAGCASGNDAETKKIKPDTANASFGNLRIQNVQLVTGDPGKHLVALGGAVFNEGKEPETITRVSVDGAGAATGGPLTIQPGGAVYLVDPPQGMAVNSPQGKTYLGPLVFPNAAEVAPGSFRKVTFAFGSAGETSLDVSVHAPSGYFEELKPTPAFTPPPAAPAPTTAAPTAAASSPAANGTGAPTSSNSTGTPASPASSGTPNAATGSTAPPAR